MTIGVIEFDIEKMFVSDGNGLARTNDSRKKATRIKVLDFIVSIRFCFGMISVSSQKHFFDV